MDLIMALIRVIVRGLLGLLPGLSLKLGWNTKIVGCVLMVIGTGMLCGIVVVGIYNLQKKRKSKLNDKGKT